MKYSESQFFKIIAVIQLGSTVLEESVSVMTFLATRETRILQKFYIFRLTGITFHADLL